MRHVTVYRYSEAVGLGEHRMMFRPRESHDLRLLTTDLQISPKPLRVRWVHDVFDNSVAVVTFQCLTSELRFETTVALEHYHSEFLEYSLEEYAATFPFQYSTDDRPHLGRALAHHYPNDNVNRWASQFLHPSGRTDTLGLLRAMSLSIKKEFRYVRRSQKGVQNPNQTLELRCGSCRDFAVLMMEATRSLGLAARFVSGYVFSSASRPTAVEGTGATHAWIQVYLPGAGWIDFDPTNDSVGNRNLIRVAVAWEHSQVVPLWGTYLGPASAFQGMDVTVTVKEENAPGGTGLVSAR